jgi:hypothetical protein
VAPPRPVSIQDVGVGVGRRVIAEAACACRDGLLYRIALCQDRPPLVSAQRELDRHGGPCRHDVYRLSIYRLEEAGRATSMTFGKPIQHRSEQSLAQNEKAPLRRP